MTTHNKNRPTFTKLDYFYHMMAIALMVFLLSSCTQAQVDRAQVAVDQAKEILAKAEAAEARVADAVAAVRKVSAAMENEKALAIVTEAESALAMAKSGVETAKGAVKTADDTLAAAKASQAAGGSTFDMLLAAAGALIPGAGVAVVALRNAANASRALRQTVAGVQGVRESLGENDWKTKAAPAMAEAQDEAVKTLIAKMQAGAK